MGSCSSLSRREAQGTEADGGEHQQHAQMWVVRVQHVLEMSGRLQPHQSLKARNLLEIWRGTMFTIFVSHQWLGFKHPDPNQERLKVLQLVLKNLIAKRLKIDYDVMSAFHKKELTARQLDGVEQCYIWLDYFCVPQLVEGHQAAGLGDEQLLYIKSIPSYVDLCDVFVALVPQALHQDTRASCDMNSWLERGWCRTELWCYHLSTRSKLPIIEVKGPDAIRFTLPLWHRYPAHSGDFAVEADRLSCSRVIETALTKHVAKLRQSNMTAYRLYLSLFENITGLKVKHRSLDEFFLEFGFTPPLQRYKHLGPLACAALSGDTDLLRRVADAKASLDCHAPGMPETVNAAGMTPLHLVLWLKGHDLEVLETLLDLRADVNSSTRDVCPPLGLCHTVEAVDLLVRHGAGVNFQGKLASGYCPLHVAASNRASPQVLARLLQLRANVHGGRGGVASMSPLHAVATSGDSKNDLRNARLLVENRADVNQIARPEGVFRCLELVCRSYTWCRSDTGLAFNFFSNLGTTPLGWCATLENHGLLIFLLHLRADPEIRGNTGLRPIDMARSQEIRAILQDPSPFTLEDPSPYVSDCEEEMITDKL